MSESPYYTVDLIVSPFYKIAANYEKNVDGTECVHIIGSLMAKYQTLEEKLKAREYQYLFTIPVRKKPQDIVEFAKKQLINICTTEVKPTVEQIVTVSKDTVKKYVTVIQDKSPLPESENMKMNAIIEKYYSYQPEIIYMKKSNQPPYVTPLPNGDYTYSALDVLPPLE